MEFEIDNILLVIGFMIFIFGVGAAMALQRIENVLIEIRDQGE